MKRSATAQHYEAVQAITPLSRLRDRLGGLGDAVLSDNSRKTAFPESGPGTAFPSSPRPAMTALPERPSPRHNEDVAKVRTRPAAKPSRHISARPRWPDFWICLLLLAATLAVYSQVRHYDFVDYDDPAYISKNTHVRAGLTARGVVWTLTSFEAANWFPLTWLTHMADYQFFGLDSGWHHLTNVWLHALNALLLFVVLKRMTGARWPSAFVAFLFALHPLHVESVAWVAERKDVLSTLCWFLTLWFYARYVERPGVGRHLAVLLAFCLGLMAKPMVVSLPFVLLLLDVWPLRRVPLSWRWNVSLAKVLFLEKLPLLALAGGASMLTFLAQGHGGAVAPLTGIPLGSRLANAVISYLVYIGDMFWPAGLAVFYPFPRTLPIFGVAAGGLALIGISFLVARQLRARSYLAVGWCWYLGTLVPVIGLVQVGMQSHADRYTYVPMIGLSIMLAWGGRNWSSDGTEQRSPSPAWRPRVVPPAYASSGSKCNTGKIVSPCFSMPSR